MKAKTADEFADALADLVGEVGRLLGEQPDRHVMKNVLKRIVRGSPEPSSEEMANLRVQLPQFKGNLGKVLRTALQTYSRKLPADPGGRPHALKPDKRKQACLDMGTLLFQGVEKVDACNRIAARYEISPWTMGRYWQGYQREQKSAAQSPSVKTVGARSRKREKKPRLK